MESISVLYNYFLKCSGVCTDTRNIKPDCLFVALKGENFDANKFAEEALTKGAKYAIIDNPEYKTDDRILLVGNSLTSLQLLATYHRKELGLPIIALTGSNGKTTTKELINAVLSSKYSTTATLGNLNNHIGVPLTLLSFTKETEIGIVEMGANHQKEIEFLCNIAQPNFGYITNFGKAHLEGFGGIEGVIKGKSELYNYLIANTRTAFVNFDDPIQAEKTKNISRVTFAVDNYNTDIRIESIEANPMVKIIYNGLTIQSNLIGKYNGTNIAAAITIGNYFKVSDAKIKQAIENYFPNNNRSQVMERNGNKIIMDAYNANPSSMDAALNNFFQLSKNNKVAILGDMFELGEESKAEHQKIVEKLLPKENIAIYFVGNHFFDCKIEKENIYFFRDYDSFAYHLKEHPLSKENTILIKGSRGMALERTLDIL